jgi:prevent-host-death family protein
MDALGYPDARAKLSEIMDRVIEDHTPVLITRHRAEALVLVSLADWNTMEETRSPVRRMPSGCAKQSANWIKEVRQVSSRIIASGAKQPKHREQPPTALNRAC